MRLRDIGEARVMLTRTMVAIATGSPVPARRPSPWIVSGLTTLAALALAYLYFRRPAEDPRTMRLSLVAPEKATLRTGLPIAISPVGRRIVFSGVADGKSQL